MKLSSFLAFVLLLGTVDAWAKKPKKKPLPEEEYPCVYEQGYTVNNDFFEDFKNIERKLDNTCFDDMDPRLKASSYIKNMAKFTTDLKDRILKESVDLSHGNLMKVDEQLSSKVDSLKKPESTGNFILDAAIVIADMNEPLKEVKHGLEMLGLGINLKELVHGEDKDPMDLKQEANMMGVIKKERDQLFKDLEEMHNRFADIEKALDAGPNSEAVRNLDAADKEMLRTVICSFMGSGQGEEFCSSKNGGKDLNHWKTGVKNKLSCADVDAFNDENRDKQHRAMVSSYAQTVADNANIKDAYGMMAKGTPARFELTVKTDRHHGKISSNDMKKRKITFNGPGGNELICSILKGPQFDKYYSGGKLKPNLLITDLNLPIFLEIKQDDSYTTKAQLSADKKRVTTDWMENGGQTTVREERPRKQYDFYDDNKALYQAPVTEVVGADGCQR